LAMPSKKIFSNLYILSFSSHVNNESWTLNLPICFIFISILFCLFWFKSKTPTSKKIENRSSEEIGMFRIPDWLLSLMNKIQFILGSFQILNRQN
jgi:hypothetical protein